MKEHEHNRVCVELEPATTFGSSLARCSAPENGQAAVEFAMFLPILAMILMGIVGFGDFIATHMELTSATRDAARRAANARVEPDPVVAVETAFNQSAEGLDVDQVTLTVEGTWAQDEDITVTAEMPYQLTVLGVVFFNNTIEAKSQVRIG